MKVLEFKHIGPFDGCFWRWEYLAVGEDEVCPIVFTEGRLPTDVVVALSRGVTLWPLYAYLAPLFKEFQWFEWEEVLDEIPYGYFPEFWDFANEHGLEFPWACDECGESQDESPMYLSGYRGNGGVGIESLGWICAECEYLQDQWYREREGQDG